MAALAFTFASLALGSAAVLGAATLRLRGASFPIGAYLLAWAGVVGLGEVLSLFDAVGRSGYVAGAAVLLAGTAEVWRRRGSPFPPVPHVRWTALREHPQLTALGAVVLAAIGYELFLVAATPPNNGDALVYHLPRVVAWLQQGHIGYFDAATQRATAFPGNAELGILWTVALLGRDTLVALPQFLAELAVLASVYGIARRLSFSRPGSAFAALLTATLAQVALQSVTAQNDLVTAAFIAGAVYFLLGRELPLAGLGLALALGTKLTALLALPVLVIIAVAVLPRRRLTVFAAWTAVAFVGFGSFWYVDNTVRTHHPFGVVPEAEPFRQQHDTSAVISTAAKVSWRFVDFSGVDVPDGLLSGLSNTGARLFDITHVDTRSDNPAAAFSFGFQPSTTPFEDSSYLGPLGLLLVIPLSAAFVFAWLGRRTSRTRGAVAAALPLFIFAVALTQAYNTWLGRFMIIPAAVTMALAAWLYDRRLRLFTLLATGIGALTLIGTHLHNTAKPAGFTAGGAIWEMPRIYGETLAVGASPRCALRAVDAAVPETAALGAVLGSNDPAYLFYGPKLERRVVPLHKPSHAYRWVIVSPFAGRVPTSGWHVQEVDGGWRLFSRDRVQQVASSAEEGCSPRTGPELRAERRSPARARAVRRRALRSG